MLERLGVPVGLLPEVVPPGTVLGTLSGDVAAETGLGDATVVAAATHDTASAVAGDTVAERRLGLRERRHVVARRRRGDASR